MYYYIYKTINVKNKKFYIGKHVTANINDGYLGSGKLLAAAIKKYSKENFILEILEFCKDLSDLNKKEIEYISEEMIYSESCYNIALGGQGGNLGEIVNKKIGKAMSKALSGVPKSAKHKSAISKSKIGYKFSQDVIKNRSSKWKEKINNLSAAERKQLFGHQKELNGFYGKTHSVETIEKIKKALAANKKGNVHPSIKPVTINGITYSSHKECMLILGISKYQLTKLKEN